MTEIVPAILTDKLETLIATVEKLRGKSDWLQIDITDGQFVETTTIRVDQLVQLAPLPFKLDLHLMVNDPASILPSCVVAKAQRIFFQLETTDDPLHLIDHIKTHGIAAGIALSPSTPIDELKPYIASCAAVLLLGVEPGRQGQTFLPQTLDKIRQLKQQWPTVPVAVDGGINSSTLPSIIEAGADIVIVGSAISQAEDPAAALAQLEGQMTQLHG